MHLVYLTNEEKKKITDGIVKAADDISKLSEDIEELNDETLSFTESKSRRTKGYYNALTGEFVSSGAFRSIKEPCKKGDIYKISAYIGGSSAVALCVYLDENGNYIDRYGWKATKQFTDEIVTVPDNDNIAFICVNNNYGDYQDFRVKKNVLNNTYTPTHKDKYFSIMGDSISTFTGYNPDGYNVQYNADYGDVIVVEDTWWMKTILALQGKLGKCNAGGASTVAGDSNYKMSSDARAKNGLGFLVNDVYTHPDVIIIEGGINDFSQFPVGDYDCKSAIPTYPCTDFKSAYACMLDKIKTEHPNAEIYCCTLFVGGKTSFNFPIVNQFGNSLEEYNNAIREVSKMFGARVIEFAECGINYHSNSIYTANDGNLNEDLHPNRVGMSLLANECIKTIEPNCSYRYSI